MTNISNVGSNVLVPKHKKLSESEAKKLFEKHCITVKDLPRLLKKDPAIEHLDLKSGDVVKITRKSEVVGETFYYRRVANE